MPGSHLVQFLEGLGLDDVAESPRHRHVDFWATRDGARCGVTIRNAPFTGYEAMRLAEIARDNGFQPVVVPRAGVRGDVAAWSDRFGLTVVPEARLHAFEAAVAAEEAALLEERLAALEATLPPEAPAPEVPAMRPPPRDPYSIGDLGVAAATAHALHELLPVAEPAPEPALEPVAEVPVFAAPAEGYAAADALWELPLPVEATPEPAPVPEPVAAAPDLPWEAAARAPRERASLDAAGLPWDARAAPELPWADADPEVVHEVHQATEATRALGRFLGRAGPDPRVTLNDPSIWGTRNRLEDIRGRLNHENVALSVEGVDSDWLRRLPDEDDA